VSKIQKVKRYYLSNSIRKEKAPFPNPSLILGIIILVVVGYGFFRFANYMISDSKMFLLKNVEVEGNKYIGDRDIIRIASIDEGMKLFQVSPQNIVTKILKNPYLCGVSVSRSLPSTLIISVQEREPVAYLVDKKIYMIDAWGKILLKKPGMSLENLPLITGLSVQNLLKRRDPLFEALRLIEIIQKVDQNLFPFISEIHISSQNPPCLYLVKGGAEVEIGSEMVPKRIYLLSEFLRKSSVLNELGTIKKMNFSYNNRIIITRKS
jgi:cell division septal protein FtsQ